MATETRPDAELATAWAAGDQSAFAAVYDRYANDLYAFAMSRLRDRAAAGDAVQDTFLRAAPRIGQLRDPSRLRAWLYAIARNQVIDAVRQPPLLTDTTELADMTADQRDPADAVAAAEAVALVRDAALGLNDRDQELLDLYLRHGLEGGDLADVVGMTRPQTYVAMNRLKARLGKAVGTVLIARRGSKDCAELAALLGGWDGRFDLEVRSKVTRHVESCPACTDRRAALIATVNLSAGAFAVPLAAPAVLREATVTSLARLGETGSTVTTEATSAWRPDGFPTSVRGAYRRTALVALLATALIAAAVIGGIVVVRRDGGSEHVATAAIDAPSPTVAVGPSATSLAASSTTATTTTAAPTSTAVVALSPPPSIGAAPEDTVATTIGSLPAGAVPEEPGLATPTATDPAPPTEAPQPSPTAAPPEDTAPPPVAETTVPVAEPPPPPPSPPPPPAVDPGRIAVLTGPITFGPTGTSGTIRIRNDGGQPAAWTATPGLGAFQVSPASGALDPAAEVDVVVSLDRASLGEGSHHTSITIGADSGGGAVQLIASVERAPVINAFVRTPPTVRTSTACGPTLVSVVVNASDESPISSVVVQWSADGAFAQLTTLTPAGGGAFTGTVGGFVTPGVHALKTIVTDSRGNSASQTTTVTATPC